jgi:hypothetical protein
MERKLQVKIAAAVLVALPVKTPRNKGGIDVGLQNV